MTKLYPKEGYVLKKYDLFPKISDVLAYYCCVADITVLPEIYDCSTNQVEMEYIYGYDGYEAKKNGLDIMTVLCDVIERLKVEYIPSDVFNGCEYNNRRKYLYNACIKKMEELKDNNVINLNSMCDSINWLYADTSKLWEQCFSFEKHYVLHGDLHPGNMIYDDRKKMWRVLDPIVTIAPIQFEYVRFLENITYSRIGQFGQLNLQEVEGQKVLQTLVRNEIINLTKIDVRLNRDLVTYALYIDSFTRTMETICDFDADSSNITDIKKSLSYCYAVADLINF